MLPFSMKQTNKQTKIQEEFSNPLRKLLSFITTEANKQTKKQTNNNKKNPQKQQFHVFQVLLNVPSGSTPQRWEY